MFEQGFCSYLLVGSGDGDSEKFVVLAEFAEGVVAVAFDYVARLT